jgi:hypothetical protein
MQSDTSNEQSPLFDARMAGALWLVVIIVSIGALLGDANLDMAGDPTTLAANVLASASKIRLTFVLFFLGKVCYLGVSALLYELLKPVNKSIALFAAFCGLAGLLRGGGGHFNVLTALSLLEDSRRAIGPVAAQMQDSARLLLATQPGFSGEDVYFGFQILCIGYLITRSRFLPRAIGVLLVLGGLGFLITSFTSFLSPALGERMAPLLLPIVLLGESALAVWLLVKGVDVEEWQATRTCSSAINPAAR